MSFSHSFTPDFYLGEGEPYDRGAYTPAEKRKPKSVWAALHAMPASDWDAMCEDCFPGVDPDHVTPETVLDLIRETDTVTDLRSPVVVWIDPDGYHTVQVY